MDVIPGNFIDAGEPEVIGQFQRRRRFHRLVGLVRQTIEDAPACRPEPAYSPVLVMMHRSAGCLWEGWTLRSSPCAARGSRIGKCLARAKDKRDYAERGDKLHSMGHGTHPS